MNKPVLLLPFIYVFKMVSFVFKPLIVLVKYMSLGFFFVTITLILFIINFILTGIRLIGTGFMCLSYIVYLMLIKIPFRFISYVLKGFMNISYLVYRFVKWVIMGFLFPFVILYEIISLVLSKIRAAYYKFKADFDRKRVAKLNKKKRLEEEKAHRLEILERRKLEEEAIKKRKKEEEIRNRLERLEEKKKLKAKRNEVYRNEDVVIEKQKFGDYIDVFLRKIISFPQSFKKKLSDKYQNSIFVKNARNKRDFDQKALLIEFETEEEERSTVKILYEYVGKNSEGKVVKGHFEAYSKVEVHSFLLSEGFEVYSIRTNKWIALFHGRSSVNNTKVKTKDLVFFLTQLSTYIKAGIPLVESLKILTRQYNNKSYQRIFRSMIYDLTMGENFSEALTKQGVAFPKLLINMVKAAELTGQLPETLDDMAEYYTETEKTRKQMITAMIYPSAVLVLSIAVITFILLFVIPRFVGIYENIDANEIPKFTQAVISFSDFLKHNILWIIIGVVIFLIIIKYLYSNVKLIRTFLQWLIMHIPGFGDIIIYNEVTIFTKTLSSLLSHNVFITDSMEVLNRITNNEIYKMLILDTISNLARGDRISLAFQNHWAFPLPAYEMLVTGEKTGQLAEMMGKVSTYYQELHRNAVTRLKSLIEPALIIFLTLIVGIIVLAIVIPMFGAFSIIQQ
ncbi:MAG: type II secretion system F family protein [Bacilli bacterium]|nr:type II secretion system F family protein [Bacilli bacterium]MDD4283090.1 type II secretion system F family protein [Bacilli bacterium]MDD4719062.1 type II secretion system F family protein [Bacilli bacterium]